MNKGIMIALYDTDKEYVKSFNEYLKEQKDTGYSIILFTEVSALEIFCKDKKADMIVMAEYLMADVAVEDGCMEEVDNIIILVEDKDVSSINGIVTVYRYQPVDLLISNILDICAEKVIYKTSPMMYTRKGKKCIVSIYSPVGRCGKTTFSINLGVQLSSRGLKVLLINLEEFSLLMKYLDSEEGENLSDLLYYYLSGNQLFAIKSEAVIRNYNGMDYIPPVKYVQDLRKTDTDTWKGFIDSMGEEIGYDTIILDISNMVEDVFGILEFSDIIVMPVIDDEVCNYKITSVREFIEHSDYAIDMKEVYNINMREIRLGETIYGIDNLMEKIINRAKG